jgi:hypothetical protein
VGFRIRVAPAVGLEPTNKSDAHSDVLLCLGIAPVPLLLVEELRLPVASLSHE